MNKVEARTALADALKAAVNGVSAIAGARRAAELYRQYGGPELIREGVRSLQFLRSSGLPEQLISSLISSTGGEGGYIQSVIDHQANSFTAVIDSASLIAAHALLEDVLITYCRVCAAFDPTKWESYVIRKKVEMSEAKAQSYESLRDSLVSELIDTLERDSLLKKYDVLMRILEPRDQETGQLDRERLVRLDALRHQIVHHRFEVIPTFEEDFHFLQANMFAAWYLTWQRYPEAYDATLFAR